jgi:hypothetical protein
MSNHNKLGFVLLVKDSLASHSSISTKKEQGKNLNHTVTRQK